MLFDLEKVTRNERAALFFFFFFFITLIPRVE